MPETVELVLPVPADLMTVARLTASAVAAAVGFDVDTIDDLRLAVDELCLSVIDEGSKGRLHMTYTIGVGVVEITCRFEPAAPADVRRARPELSVRILDALVDEHGSLGDGGTGAWLRMRRPTN